MAERGDTLIRDATGHDEVEMAEVGGDVQGKAVAGYPSGDSDTDSRKLLVADPHAGQHRHPGSRHAEPEYRTNQHLFQIANVTVNVTAIRAQVDDGVADELTGTMIRDVPAASRLDYLHAFFFQPRGRRHDVRAIVARLYAERDDWRVFEQEKLIWNRVLLPLLHKALLQIDAFSVGDRSKPVDFKRTRHSVLVLEPLSLALSPDYIHASSKCSSRSFTNARNRPASAPST